MNTTAPKKATPIRRHGGWTMYEYSVNKVQDNAILVYKHDCGAWAVLRPLKPGLPLIVFHDDELPDEAATSLQELTEFAMRGKRGVDPDVQALVVEGGQEEAYADAGIE